MPVAGRPLTLGQALRRKELYRGDYFRLVAGQEMTINFSEVSIPESESDTVYRLTQITQRRYSHPETDKQDAYLAPSFQRVDNAYASRDIVKFNRAVNALLSAFAWD